MTMHSVTVTTNPICGLFCGILTKGGREGSAYCIDGRQLSAKVIMSKTNME